MRANLVTALAATATVAHAFSCPPAGNVFPLPKELPKAVLDKIAASLKETIDSYASSKTTSNSTQTSRGFGNATLSVELTSPSKSFFEYHHVGALAANSTRNIDGGSVYRIGSISKIFATLTMILASLDPKSGVTMDDSVVKYYPELGEDIRRDGVQWKDVTLRALAGHLGGLDRESGSLDLLAYVPDQDYTEWGLPPIESIPISDFMCEAGKGSPECTEKSTIEFLKKADHSWSQVFDRTTYSNAGFSLLGLAMAKHAGTTFGELLESAVFSKINMTRSSVIPPKKNGVIPDGEQEWDHLLGPQDGSGGMFTTTNDLSSFIRGLMSATLLPQTEVNRWLKPLTFGSGMETATGLTWEIFRLPNATNSKRNVDVYTKGGAVSGYLAQIFMFPDYGFGGTVLTAGGGDDAGKAVGVSDALTNALPPLLEEAAREYTRDTYAGSYVAENDKLNSSMVLTVDNDQPGIRISSWISNSTNMLKGPVQTLADGDEPVEVRLFPVSRNDIPESPSNTVAFRGLIGKFNDKSGVEPRCDPDLNIIYYAGKPLLQTKFKHEKGVVTEVEIPAFRVTLKKTGKGGASGSNTVGPRSIGSRNYGNEL